MSTPFLVCWIKRIRLNPSVVQPYFVGITLVFSVIEEKGVRVLLW